MLYHHQLPQRGLSQSHKIKTEKYQFDCVVPRNLLVFCLVPLADIIALARSKLPTLQTHRATFEQDHEEEKVEEGRHKVVF